MTRFGPFPQPLIDFLSQLVVSFASWTSGTRSAYWRVTSLVTSIPTPSLPTGASLSVVHDHLSGSGNMVPAVIPCGGRCQARASLHLSIFDSLQLRHQSWVLPRVSFKCGVWMAPLLLPTLSVTNHSVLFLTAAPMWQPATGVAPLSLSPTSFHKPLPSSSIRV